MLLLHYFHYQIQLPQSMSQFARHVFIQSEVVHLFIDVTQMGGRINIIAVHPKGCLRLDKFADFFLLLVRFQNSSNPFNTTTSSTFSPPTVIESLLFPVSSFFFGDFSSIIQHQIRSFLAHLREVSFLPPKTYFIIFCCHNLFLLN